MAKKEKTKEENEGEIMNKAMERWMRYAKLSRLLFMDGPDTPYRVNDIKEGSEFYELARSITKELEISWEEMNSAESNRIMLAMLEDTYRDIQVDEKYRYTIKISVSPLK